MYLEQLQYFRALVDHPHIAETAQSLYVSQSALSRAIRHLEEELGVTLFEKEGRRIKVTRDGRDFAAYVTESLDKLDEGVALMHSRAGSISGEVRIAGIATLRTWYLAALVDAYRRAYPFVEIHDALETTWSMVQKLKEGVYDVAFLGPVEEEGVECEPLMHQQLVAVVSHVHRLADRDSVSVDNLVSCTVATYQTDFALGTMVDRFIHERGRRFERPLIRTCNDEMTLGRQVEQNKCVGIALLTSNLSSYPGLVLMPIEDERTRDFYPINMAYRSGSRTPVQESFLSFARAFAAPRFAFSRIDRRTTVWELLQEDMLRA